MPRYAILAVEGPHDQAFVARTLKELGFKEFGGKEENLDTFWKQFVPKYPVGGRLYTRLGMPTIVYTNALSVAIYAGTGSNLCSKFPVLLTNHPPYYEDICAFGVVADADRRSVDEVSAHYHRAFEDLFPDFPTTPGVVTEAKIRTGIFVLPDNEHQGVLDTLILRCGEATYPKHIAAAREFIGKFDAADTQHWRPFDREKALVASVVSILKPGKTNTVSIKDNDWISKDTLPLLEDFTDFLKTLLAA